MADVDGSSPSGPTKVTYTSNTSRKGQGMLRTLVSIRGRVGRLEFWVVSLVLWLGLFLIGLLPQKVWAIAMLPPYWMQIALTTRRFHDLGYSGWVSAGYWVATLVFYLLWAVIAYLASIETDSTIKIIGIGLAIIATMVVFLGLGILACFKAGDPGDNEYGSPDNGSIRLKE